MGQRTDQYCEDLRPRLPGMVSAARIWRWICDVFCNAKSMLKIQRMENGEVVFTVVGRLDPDNVGELRQLLAMEPAGRSIVLDLKDLVLADREAIRLLRRCESQDVVLQNCPQYIRGWMACGEEQR